MFAEPSNGSRLQLEVVENGGLIVKGRLSSDGHKISISKVHADFNAEQPRDYWNYKHYHPKYGTYDNYQWYPHRKLGRGKFCEVYAGTDRRSGDDVVLKKLKPGMKRRKIRREVKILHNVQGGPNIIKLYDVIREPYINTTTLVFEFVDNIYWKKIYQSFSDYEIRFYIFELIKSLEYAHARGIMHRDVKPLNVVIDHRQKKLRLIDWGLAEFYHKGMEYSVRVATKHYKAPELLVGLRTYDYSVDMWGVGVMFASMLFWMNTSFFEGVDHDEVLIQIAECLGTSDLFTYCDKYNIKLPDELIDRLGSHTKRAWESYITDENKHLACEDGLDLLDKLLVYDHPSRLTAEEALKHPYFDPVRNGLPKEDGESG
eukprot:CAMPEP_0174259472 /NCGR_PEP_ID=MMETSP0439-20130205/8293_1 /TAXON_ID=0 /ORGANISM="Stereomyxa ramosa, Strain Chinc5" /LENGTH=371 /DNA_ID=CAMNT_0015343369 /DNA_START=143 /DNA_END=1258 /DNA_ORIENTATION=-